MARLYDMAQMTVTSGGAAAITLGAGVAADGITYLTFLQAGVQDQDVVSYRIADGAAWEIGRAPVTAGPPTQLGSRTVLLSTNANAAIPASTSATVSIIALAEDFTDGYATGPITAATTGGQAGATQLTADFSVVTTVAAGGAVALRKAVAGTHCYVRNSGLNPLLVYPRYGDNAIINAQAANAAITVPVNSTAFFAAQNLTQWFTIP